MGSCWESWARLGSPWLQVSPALTILPLDSCCLLASSGRAELLPSPPTSRLEEFSRGPFGQQFLLVLFLPSKTWESRRGESERCAVPRGGGGQAGEPLWKKRTEKHLTCRRRRRAGRRLGTILSSPCAQPAGAWLAAVPAPLGSRCRRGQNPRGSAPRSAAAAGGLRGGGPLPSALPFARRPAPAFYNLPRSRSSAFPPSSSPGDGLHPPQAPAPPVLPPPLPPPLFLPPPP